MATIQHCRSCGAPVIWRKHVKTGKPAPIDAEPSDAGNIVMGTDDNFYAIVDPANLEWKREAFGLHTNHFATCPNAKKHRKEAK